MKNYLKLTGLMMSALLCLFTSCVSNDDNDDNGTSSGVATAEVELLISAETLEWAEGSFVITFLPSGKTEEVSVNDIMFAFNANPVEDKELLTYFKSKNVKRATHKTLCSEKVDEISVKQNLKVKQGVATTDDVTYQFEVAAGIHYGSSLYGGKSTSGNKSETNIKGSGLESFLSRNSAAFAFLYIR